MKKELKESDLHTVSELLMKQKADNDNNTENTTSTNNLFTNDEIKEVVKVSVSKLDNKTIRKIKVTKNNLLNILKDEVSNDIIVKVLYTDPLDLDEIIHASDSEQNELIEQKRQLRAKIKEIDDKLNSLPKKQKEIIITK